MSIEDFLSYCLLYDMGQILKSLSKGNIDEDSLEMLGLVILSPKLMKNADLDLLNKDFSELNFLISKELLKGMASSIKNICGETNPFKVAIQTVNDEKIVSSQKIQSNFCLPSVLKLIEDPLFDEYATTLYRFATIISKADNVVTKDEEETLKGIYQSMHNPVPKKPNDALNISKVDKQETLDDVLAELDSLVGLQSVKQEVNSLINFIKIQKEREKVGLKSSKVSYHCIFTGSPGTGKTTIARIVAKIYMHLGILKKGHFVETDRSGLVAEYVGQTAVKTNKTIDSAIDGVLFIDEAYSLGGDDQDSFGKEAVATLIKRMEDNRDRLIVILAGYTEEMKAFIDTNPGFESRFNRYIVFSDYTPEEMFAIFEGNCTKLDYRLTNEAKAKLLETITKAYSQRDKSFGNGRFIRNIFEKTIENQANRLAGLSNITKEVLTSIEVDIPRIVVHSFRGKLVHQS